jgi:predicted LPLAT superfamily acyltransferase
LTVISIHIGAKYFQIPDQLAGSLPHFAQWFMGSLVLGGVLGFAAMALSYFVFKIFHWQLYRSEKAEGQTWLSSAGLWILKQVLGRLGWSEGRLLIYAMVPYLYLFDSRARKGLNEYYGIQNSKETYWARQKRVLRHLFRYGEVLVDELYQKQREEFVFNVRAFGTESVQPILQKDGGFISLSAHVGGWDVAAEPIGLGEACRDGRGVLMNGDRTDFGCELVPFLGRLAPFSTSAFEHAATSHKPVIFTLGFKSKELNYDFYARTPLLYDFDPKVAREVQIHTWTEEYAEALEERVRQYPDQWFNLYNFWSRPPASARLQGQHSLIEEKAGRWSSACTSEARRGEQSSAPIPPLG